MKQIVKIFLTVVCLVVLSTGVALAAEPVQETIDVNGTATQEALPNLALINMGVLAQGDSAQQVRERGAVVSERMLQALAAQGILAEEVKTANYDLMPLYAASGKNKITGYELNHSFIIRVTDLTKLGTIIDKMFAVGANNFNNVTFTVQDSGLAEQELLMLAVANARAKAWVVAKAGERELGKMLHATIGNVSGFNYSNSRMDKAMFMEAGSSATHLMPGNLKVTANVNVTFALL
ncbi:MAG: SIMPL domain-containing protein [Acidaminococcaceae bacterium]